MAQTKHDQLVHEYDDVYLLCRDLRHVWEVVGFYRLGGREIRRVLDCSRCGTQRADTWTTSGERQPARYSYATDYKVPGGGMQMYEVRKEVLARATIFKSQAEMFNAVSNGSSAKIPRAARRAS